MKTAPPTHSNSASALTCLETLTLLALASTFALLVLLLCPPCLLPINRNPRMGDQLNNGRQIFFALSNYAAEAGRNERFPAEYRVGASEELFETSNDALASLLPKYIDDKAVFLNKQSAHCRKLERTPESASQLRTGECDWAYVRGLKSNFPADWPLLANAFAPGTTTYVDNRAKKGGVWEGKNAVVIWASGSAEVLATKKRGETFYVPRRGAPGANAFVQDGEWLAGDKVKVLAPKE